MSSPGLRPRIATDGPDRAPRACPHAIAAAAAGRAVLGEARGRAPLGGATVGRHCGLPAAEAG